MIVVSILIHFLGNYLPKWILSKAKQNNPFFKLSGLFVDFLATLFILFLIHLLSPKTHYIDNKDAIYGLEFNETMQELGFENGDKIVSVNNQSIKKVSEITNLILFNPNSIIKLRRNDIDKELKINDEDVMKILQSEGNPIAGKHSFNKEVGKIEEIKQTKEKFSFGKVLKNYQNNIKEAYDFITTKKDYKKVGGIDTASKSFIGQISLLPFYCIIVGLLNLLPLPGFSLGNFIISIIESKRGKAFNLKKKNILSLCTICVVVIFILSLHY